VDCEVNSGTAVGRIKLGAGSAFRLIGLMAWDSGRFLAAIGFLSGSCHARPLPSGDLEACFHGEINVERAPAEIFRHGNFFRPRLWEVL
jgi:hypothetical protein